MEQQIIRTTLKEVPSGIRTRQASAYGLNLPCPVKWRLDILKNIVILNRQAVHFSTGTAVHFSTGIYKRSSVAGIEDCWLFPLFSSKIVYAEQNA